MADFNSKTFLVTGANSGIGKCVTETLLSKGARVLGVDLNTDKLEMLKSKYSGQIYYLKFDLNHPEEVQQIFERVREVGILNGMVYCAGLSPLMKLSENDVNKMLVTYNVNVISFIEMLKFFHSEEFSVDESSVVAMSSIAASVASFRQTVYSSTKAALEQVVKCAAKEFLDRRIRVNTVAAGAVETEMFLQLEKQSEGIREKFNCYYPLGMMPTSEVVNIILYLLSEDAKHVDGSIFRADSAFFVNK